MKFKLLALLIFVFLTQFGMAQEYKIITTVESIVAGGIGRSRMTEAKQENDYKPLTTSRTEGTKSDQGDVSRGEIKIDAFDETKLLNFYSLAGINFQNIASNDALITAKINEMVNEGWQLNFVTSGVESVGSASDNHGIYITRLFFTKS